MLVGVYKVSKKGFLVDDWRRLKCGGGSSLLANDALFCVRFEFSSNREGGGGYYTEKIVVSRRMIPSQQPAVVENK